MDTTSADNGLEKNDFIEVWGRTLLFYLDWG